MKSNNTKLSINGKVISKNMEKTVVVEIEGSKLNKRYHKRYKTSKKIKAHDERDSCKVGDNVEIIASRPISKEKKYKVKQERNSK